MKNRFGGFKVGLVFFFFGMLKAFVLCLIASLLIALVGALFGANFRGLVVTSFKVAFIILELACLVAAISVAKVAGEDKSKSDKP